MKTIQVNIQVENEKKFKARIEINNLSREDANEFEEEISKSVERVVNDYCLKLRDELKKDDPTTKSEITIIS